MSRALCSPGQHAAKSRKKCTTKSTFLSETMPNIHRLKKFSGRLSDKPFLVTEIPPHLKYVTSVPCNLLLITVLVCNCRSFSDVNVSQGSVATHMRCGGICNKYFAANLLENLIVKKFENWLRINRGATINQSINQAIY